MQKTWIVLLLVIVLAAGILFLASGPRALGLGGFTLGSPERAWLEERSVDFLEDIQFKDFDKASTYHLAATQQKRDIPELIRRVFKVKHEFLDIVSYKVLEVDLDRSNRRAKIRVLVNYRIIGDKEVRDDPEAVRDLEMLLYWFKQEDGQWAMELESSLR